MLKLVTEPDSRLRTKAEPVEIITKVMRAQIPEMLNLTDLAIAAPQVGIMQRFFVVKTDEHSVFINPVITHRSGLQRREEACLSIPGVIGTVTRARSIVVEAYGLDCEKFTLKATGLLATIIQHECDHLDGILFTDKISKVSK